MRGEQVSCGTMVQKESIVLREFKHLPVGTKWLVDHFSRIG
jgi:hypothetical protein